MSSEDAGTLLSDPETAWLAVRIVTRVEAMGLLDPDVPRRLSESSLVEALRALEAAGLARRQVQALTGSFVDPELLRAIDDAVTGSPVPEREWPGMISAT